MVSTRTSRQLVVRACVRSVWFTLPAGEPMAKGCSLNLQQNHRQAPQRGSEKYSPTPASYHSPSSSTRTSATSRGEQVRRHQQATARTHPQPPPLPRLPSTAQREQAHGRELRWLHALTSGFCTRNRTHCRVSRYSTEVSRRADVSCAGFMPLSAIAASEYFNHGSLHRLNCTDTSWLCLLRTREGGPGCVCEASAEPRPSCI